MLASTPRSAASAGALTNVTGSSITEENSPRNAESRSTPTSSEASSPRTCTEMDTGSSAESTPISKPSLRTRSSHGATSSPTTPPPTFTASGTNSPASASFTLSATSVPARSCASAVDAPRCGVTTTCGRSNNGLSVRRFGGEHVESRSADVSAGDGFGKRLLDDQAAACGVDDDDARLGLGQRLLADQAGGLRRLRQVHGDEVRRSSSSSSVSSSMPSWAARAGDT